MFRTLMAFVIVVGFAGSASADLVTMNWDFTSGNGTGSGTTRTFVYTEAHEGGVITGTLTLTGSGTLVQSSDGIGVLDDQIDAGEFIDVSLAYSSTVPVQHDFAGFTNLTADDVAPFASADTVSLNTGSNSLTSLGLTTTFRVEAFNAGPFVGRATLTNLQGSVTPEPSSFMLCGLAGLGLVRRRRKRNLAAA